MTKDTITLRVEGRVTLDDFSRVIAHFSNLLFALSKEVTGGHKIDWEIDQLRAGSAVATVRGYSIDYLDVEKVVSASEIVWDAMQTRSPIPYSSSVTDYALAMTGVINGNISSIVFITPEQEVTISESLVEILPSQKKYSYGTITGVADTLARRRGLKVTVYDHIFDSPIYCLFTNEQEEMMRNLWGRRVKITGKIYRDPETGRPKDVRDISRVEILPEESQSSYKDARGAISWIQNGEHPERYVRRLRNAD